MAKKKYLSILYMSLLLVLFVCLSINYSVSAMTNNEVENALEYLKDNLASTNSSYTAVQNYFTSTRSEKFLTYLQGQDISSYNLLTITYINSSRMVYDFYNFDTSQYYLKFLTSGQNVNLIGIYSKATNELVSIQRKQFNHYTYSSNLNDIGNTSNSTNVLNSMSGVYFYLFTPEIEILKQNGVVATPQEIQNFIGYQYLSTTYNPSNITLTATSNHKFGFSDKNQCQAYLTGYNISDIQFYVDRYIDSSWEQFSNTSDDYLLYDEQNDQLYSNPYYVFWHNINYYPVGTYRYRAVYDYDHQYYSNSFDITYEVINNQSTGTVDTDGNIDVNINTGETVDNIKDYLGEDPTITKNDIENSFPTIDVDDPSHNFFVWVFDSIENIFTTTEDRTFTFSLFTGNTYTIHSSDISIPNNAIKTLVGLSCDFAICYYIIRDVHKTIEKLKKGNFESIAEDDISANML